MKIIKQIFHKTRRVVAKWWLGNMHVTQIAITGSQGKTAVSQGLYAMLKTLRPVVVTDTNLDTIYNVPITALKIRPYHHSAIFELGIDKLNEMDFHLDIVKPDIAVVTGLSPVHTDEAHMKSFENVKKEKRKLVEALTDKGIAILNYSDENVRGMATHTKAKVVWYGCKEDFESCHSEPAERVTGQGLGKLTTTHTQSKLNINQYVSYSNVTVTTEGTEFDLYDRIAVSDCRQSQNDIAINQAQNNSHSGKRLAHPESGTSHENSTMSDFGHGQIDIVNSKSKTIHIKTKLIGTFHAANICAIYCILKTLNPYFVEQFGDGVYELLAPLRGRMAIEDGPNNTIILNDSLRANPTSTAGGLETFANIEYKKGRKVAILADMGELEHPEEEHKKIGKLIAKLPIDMVVCAGKMQKFVAIEAAKNRKCEVHYYDTVTDAKREILKIIMQDDFIYLKGSLYSHVGKIFEK